MHTDLVMTPGGWRPRAQVHLAPLGQTVSMQGHPQLPVKRYPRPGVPDGANWITCGYWGNKSSASVRALAARWRVPPPPSSQACQVLYLFNGMQPADGAAILQPVLQWGESGADEDGLQRTGPFWTVASWLAPAPNGHIYHTPHVRVAPGDLLAGRISLLDQSPAGARYHCCFAGVPGTDLLTMPIQQLTWCVHALAAYDPYRDPEPPYGLRAASEYPAAAKTVFQDITVGTATGAPPDGDWVPWDIVDHFGEHTLIVSAQAAQAEIDIHYV